MKDMKLSILDQSPISSGQTPREALMESVNLAIAGEELGYTRYWIAEHITACLVSPVLRRK